MARHRVPRQTFRGRLLFWRRAEPTPAPKPRAIPASNVTPINSVPESTDIFIRYPDGTSHSAVWRPIGPISADSDGFIAAIPREAHLTEGMFIRVEERAIPVAYRRIGQIA